MMRVVIGCGGTGGHIMPAIAIADIIRTRCERAEILFIGSQGGMEEKLVPQAGYAIRTLPVTGFTRRVSTSNIKAAYLAVRSSAAAAVWLDSLRPDIVIGTGGYASYPALRAAIRRGIPAVVHESNAVAGLAVRHLSGRLDRVWLNFDAARETLSRGASVLTVGNPLPRGYERPIPASLPTGKKYMILSFGGSRGASALNHAVLSLMEWEKERSDIYHVHATGEREYEAFCKQMEIRGLSRRMQYRVVPFLSPMAHYMAAADVVICRAGAMSISELAALSKAAVLIPSPNVTGDHQYRNAKALADKGAALLLRESEMTSTSLRDLVFPLLACKEKRHALESAIHVFHHPTANDEIYADICRLCRKKGRETV